MQRPESGTVQFTHQTVKEFVRSQSGQNIIQEGVDEQPIESGHLLIYRYLLKLIQSIEFNQDSQCSLFVLRVMANLREAAHALEWHEGRCIADSFDSAL